MATTTATTTTSASSANIDFLRGQHHHVPKVFALPDSTPTSQKNAESSSSSSPAQQQKCGQLLLSNTILQLVLPGQGRDRMATSNLIYKQHDNTGTDTRRPNQNQNQNNLSLHRPILIRDTPESIGMKIPKGKNYTKRKTKVGTTTKKAKKKIVTTTTNNNCTTTDGNVHDNDNDDELPISKASKTTTAEQQQVTPTVPFSVRDVADVVGYNSPVQMIDVVDQTNTADDWTFGDLVEYFEDETRLKQQQQQQQLKQQSMMTTPTTDNNKNNTTTSTSEEEEEEEEEARIIAPTKTTPTGGRVRRKAAIRSEQILDEALRPQTKIFNQISYEFSGTPLHTMVRSPTFVREIDWIDIAWPDEKKPQHINDANNINNNNSNNNSNNISKKKGGSSSGDSKGIIKDDGKVKKKGGNKVNSSNNERKGKGSKAKEYPVVQYYCLTSAGGSYTDFHIDFGGSSVWYHVVRGQKVFVVSPPTRENLSVYEEWLCRSDQAETFLPDLMKERSCPDIHSYSSSSGCYSSSSSLSSGIATTASSSSFSSAPMTATTRMNATSTYSNNNTGEDLQDELKFFQSSLTKTLSTNNALRFTLNAGETLFIPSGWIHAVYTPVDSLVFGGNFIHGLDMQMQLSINTLETRTRVLDIYRFPHFGALQMYAGGMYLRRLRSMQQKRHTNTGNDDQRESVTQGGRKNKVDDRKHQKNPQKEYPCHEDHRDQPKEKDEKENTVNSDINPIIATSPTETTVEESVEQQVVESIIEKSDNASRSSHKIQLPEQSSSNSNNTKSNEENTETNISQRELEGLPMLMNALEYWWMSVQERKEENREGSATGGIPRTFDSITSHSYFENAALYVAEENGCDSVEDFISSLRKQYDRVSKEQWGDDCIVSHTTPTIDQNIISNVPVLTTIPIAIGKPVNRSKNKLSEGVEGHKKKKRRKKKSNTETDLLDDPLDVALSTSIREYLASIQITTAAQLLLARTTDVAKNFPDWRKKKGMPLLQNNGEISSVSVWKRKVRLKAALVGANKLARLNEGTNMKAVVDIDVDVDEKMIKTKGTIDDNNPPLVVADKYLFKRVAKEFSISPQSSSKRQKRNNGGDEEENAAAVASKIFFGTVERSLSDGKMYRIKYDDGDEEDLETDEMLHALNVYQQNIYCDPTGWKKEIIPRKNTGSTTKKMEDHYWYTPKKHFKLRSMIEVQKFQVALKETNGDEEKAKNIYKKIKVS